MSATWVTFLFETGNFLLLAAVLGWIFFRPVRQVIEERQARLRDEEREAAEVRAEAEKLREGLRARSREIEASQDQLRQELRAEADRERRTLLEEARARAERERTALTEELRALRGANAHDLAQDAAEAARDVVVRLLGAIEGPELERALVERACHEVARLREADSLAPVLVESAAELDADALSSLARAARLSAEELEHRRSAELVAGVRVLTARGLVDVSATGMAEGVARELSARLAPADALPPTDGDRG